MPRQPYASPVMNIRIIFICHHPFFVDFITVGANRIRPINVFFANRIRPVFLWGNGYKHRLRPYSHLEINSEVSATYLSSYLD